VELRVGLEISPDTSHSFVIFLAVPDNLREFLSIEVDFFALFNKILRHDLVLDGAGNG
jgi:hypothetical protein